MLEVHEIGKRFPAVTALDRVSLRVAAGEVHGVIGENGAGKSTLMKILAGIERPDAGRLVLDGRPYAPRNAREATDAGVAMIHQELNLAPALTAAENIVLGREPRRWGFVRRGAMRAEAKRRLDEVGASIDPDAIVGDLPVAGQQLVEIAKALAQQSKVLILDEPTAVLSERETRSLFALIRRLRASGTAILYISHLLPEVRDLCDRISVLRDGRLVAETTPQESDADRLASLMVGRELADVYPPRAPRPAAGTRLAVRGVSVPGHVREASFEIAPGEILGLAGLVGSGRTELAEAIAGLRRMGAGEVRLEGTAVRVRSARQALDRGIAYVSEDRKGRGVFVELACRENLVLPNLAAYGAFVPSRRREREATAAWIRTLDIRCPDPAAPMRTLSGGNQQKFAVASRLDVKPTVLLLDEPTRGVDVGAKRELYHLIARLASEGLACLVISSELPELIGLCHRIAVMRQGRLVGEVDPAAQSSEETERSIMRLAAGVSEQAA
ncbi:MAG: sugar ABC transporter ATP-binding protein [Phycisphaerales bacterium]